MAVSHEGNSTAECEKYMCQEQVPLPGARKDEPSNMSTLAKFTFVLKPVERQTPTRGHLKDTLVAYALKCPSHNGLKEG